VISTFLVEVAGITTDELAMLRSAPSWPGRVVAPHTIFRGIYKLEALPPFNPARFQALTTPALLLLGGDSIPACRKNIEQIDRALPDSRIVVMPGQQHVAMNTAPELFVRAVLAFLA
jgi:pimeloyl-ACP methyl ester carboxylesterase